ncbi:Calx-beta domain-containing protein [Nocardioides sp.]|uniref:Calx-beta domain-containing protein n=1 Tax=Nocardioides sp. TaxID=35761 RepID=UPI0039E6B028
MLTKSTLALVLLLGLLGGAAPAYAAKRTAVIAKPVTVTEAAGRAVITVKLRTKAKRSTRISWATAPGTATTTDFVAATGKARIKKGKKSATIRIVIVDDSVAEADETFTVSLKGSGLKPATVTVTIRDDDGGGAPGTPGGGTVFPETITGTFSGYTKPATGTGSISSDSLHVDWSGTITYVFQPNDPYLGTPWRDGTVHYAVQSVAVSWTASGGCSGSGTLTTSQVDGQVYLDDDVVGPGYDDDLAYWDYQVFLAPNDTGDMPVVCGETPGNAAVRVGQGGNGGALIDNGFATGQPASNRYTTDLVHFAGTQNPPSIVFDNTWNLVGSGQAAYTPAG